MTDHQEHQGRSRWVNALALIALVALTITPALADKVVLFKNGKSMKAKSVKEDKGWTRLEIEGGVVGVRSFEISLVQDAVGAAATKAEPLPNLASGGGGAGGGYVGQSYGGGEAPAEAPPQPEEYQPPPENRGNPGARNPNLPTNIPGLRSQAGGLGGGLAGRPGGGARSFGGGSFGNTGLTNSRFGNQQNPASRQTFTNPVNNNSNGDE
jgi:hypothetical protein